MTKKRLWVSGASLSDEDTDKREGIGRSVGARGHDKIGTNLRELRKLIRISHHRDVERIVSTIFDEMSEALARGERSRARGFGAFL